MSRLLCHDLHQHRPLSIVWSLRLFIRQKKTHPLQTHRSPSGFGPAEASLQVWKGFDRTPLSVFSDRLVLLRQENGCLRRPLWKTLSSVLQISLIAENKRHLVDACLSPSQPTTSSQLYNQGSDEINKLVCRWEIRNDLKGNNWVSCSWLWIISYFTYDAKRKLH